ncbi:MAG TPA: methyltransferase domain-containing protein [Anaeromyxobacteraceae bacterium]|nr:methyltransferase domain-containing protein [Anaeromyxobacteraceae bacterium]
MRVFIGNLPPESDEASVRRACQASGAVTSVDVAPAGGSGRAARFALVEMPRDAEARAALGRLNAEGLDGRSVSASEVPEGVALRESPTFSSFLTFLGGRPFRATRELFSMVAELAAGGHTWVMTLDDPAAACVVRHPRLVSWIEGLSFLTMGPLEGPLEWNLARLGAARVLGVEGYRPNYLKCRVLLEAFPSLPVAFAEGDLARLPVQAGFEVVICSGVLYHLHEPQALLRTIRASNPRRVYLTTQAAVDPPHPAFSWYRLGAAASVAAEGGTYRGRWYPDVRPAPDDYHAGLDGRPSFWFYPEELRRLLPELGFGIEEFVVKDARNAGMLVDAILTVP